VPARSIDRLVSDHFPVIARDLLGPMLDYLGLAREALGGDVDKFLILMVIGIRTTEHDEFASYTQAELLSGAVPVFPSRGVNIQSVADSLGAPKETVRRKVAELVKSDWIRREDNSLYFTAKAYQELAHVREALEHLAVQYHALVAGLIEAERAEPRRQGRGR